MARFILFDGLEKRIQKRVYKTCDFPPFAFTSKLMFSYDCDRRHSLLGSVNREASEPASARVASLSAVRAVVRHAV